MRSSSAQPAFTRTQTSRNTVPPNSRSMSRRAAVAICLHARAALPSRIARWLAFSHQDGGVDAAQLAVLLEAVDRTAVA